MMVFTSLLFAQIDLTNIDISTLSPEQLKAYQAYMSKTSKTSNKSQQTIDAQAVTNSTDFSNQMDGLFDPKKTMTSKNGLDLSPPPFKIQDTNESIEINDEPFTSPLDYRNNEEMYKSIQKDKIKKSKVELRKFGETFFANKNSVNPYSIPTSDNYILTNGDKLSANVYGQQVNTFELKVDKNGNVEIPNIGIVKVGGLKYADAKSTLSNALIKAYPTSTIVLDIVYYSTIQVYLTGEVKSPGLYNLPSFATVKDLLMVSNGINDTGTYRDIAVKRDGKVIERFDAYKMIKLGEDETPTLLRNGDLIVVGKSAKQISIAGQISNPGIYELKENESFKQLFDYASNFKFDASKDGIRLTRFIKNENIKVFTLSFDNLLSMKPQNGDFIEIFPLSMLSKKMVNLKGNIAYEGEREIPTDGKLSTLFQKEINFYGRNNFFLENTAFDFGTIKRRNIEGSYEMIAFNINEVLAKTKEILLKDADEIYVASKLQLGENPYVYVSGKVVDREGRYQFFENMELSSLFKSIKFKSELVNDLNATDNNISDLNASLGMVKTAKELKPKVIKRTMLHVNQDYIKLTRIDNRQTIIKILSLAKDGHFPLNAYDKIEFFDFYDTNARYTANISGEVYSPGIFDIQEGSTINDLIALSGGFTKKAFIKDIELARYSIVGNERKRVVHTLNLSKEEDKNTKLHDDDQIIVRAIPKWSETKYIELLGQVKFPGKYPVEDGESLSDVIQRAGGFTDIAFLKGAVFTRKSVQELQQKEMLKSIEELKQQAAYVASSPAETKESDVASKKMLVDMVSNLQKDAAKTMPIGRVIIALNDNIEKFKQSSYNVPVEDGDKLYIPKINKTVTVLGEVMSPNTFIFDDKLALEDYIKKAGGFKKESADKSGIYVVKSNGDAARLDSGYFLSSNVDIEHGDAIIIPRKIEVTSSMSMIAAVADITYKLAVTVASLSTVGAL